jgi:hypothetical protein
MTDENNNVLGATKLEENIINNGDKGYRFLVQLIFWKCRRPRGGQLEWQA